MDLLRLYADKLQRHRLLTAEEELKLFRRRNYVRRKLKQARDRQDLDAIKRWLAERLLVKEEVFLANWRLVYWCAVRFGRGFHRPELIDRVQIGNIGLMIAERRFKLSKHVRFATYATWWVRQTIRRAMDNERQMVRMPAHVLHQVEDFRHTRVKFTHLLGRRPTTEELADLTGLVLGDVDRLDALDRKMCPPERLSMRIGRRTRLADLIQDRNMDDPAATVDALMVRQTIDRLLRTLTERVREIIKLRFGLVDGIAYTLEEVAGLYGVTRERIRQIELTGMAKLCRLGNQQYLKEVLSLEWEPTDSGHVAKYDRMLANLKRNKEVYDLRHAGI